MLTTTTVSGRVVLDTNIISSRYLTPHSRVAPIVDLWEQGALEIITSEVILTEYAEVLRYPRLRKIRHLADDQLTEIIDEAFQEFTEVVTPAETPAVVKDDPDDDHTLAAADTARVDCIVTGAPHLLEFGSYKGIPILSPAEFLIRYFPEQISDLRVRALLIASLRGLFDRAIWIRILLLVGLTSARLPLIIASVERRNCVATGPHPLPLSCFRLVFGPAAIILFDTKPHLFDLVGEFLLNGLR